MNAPRFVAGGERVSRGAAVAVSVALVIGAASTPAVADAYPSHEVKLVVPFPPGGVTDLTARVLARHLATLWKQPVTVVNAVGLGGTTGTMQVLHAPADGYTMLASATGQATQNPALDSRLPYRWNEPTIVARFTVSPLVFVVAGDSPWNSLRQAMDAVAKEPERYRYGTSGNGGVGSIALAQLLDAAGVDGARIGRVPLEGGAPLLAAVMDGRTSFAAQYQAEMRDLIASGRIKPLAVSTAMRTPPLPDVPTGREAGFPAFSLIGWNGIVGPAGLPPEVVVRWNSSIRELLRNAEFQRDLTDLGATPAYLDASEFKSALEIEYMTALQFAEKLGIRK